MMNDLNIEEYEKAKKPESYFVRYQKVYGLRMLGDLCTKDVVISFPTREEAEDYAKKIKYARKFLGDDLDERRGKIKVGFFEDQFE
tara:strand:- start:2124 stop:2381 length:258 start_codon:yes stop_codon:yes gene_type:complete